MPRSSSRETISSTITRISCRGNPRSRSAMTVLGRAANAVTDRTSDAAVHCRDAPVMIIHEFLTGLYGVEAAPERLDELETRAASALVQRILALDPRPLREARSPARRLV